MFSNNDAKIEKEVLLLAFGIKGMEECSSNCLGVAEEPRYYGSTGGPHNIILRIESNCWGIDDEPCYYGSTKVPRNIILEVKSRRLKWDDGVKKVYGFSCYHDDDRVTEEVLDNGLNITTILYSGRKPAVSLSLFQSPNKFTVEELRIIEKSLNKNFDTVEKLMGLILSSLTIDDLKNATARELVFDPMSLCALAYHYENQSNVKVNNIIVKPYRKRLLLAAEKCDLNEIKAIFDEIKNKKIPIDINSIRNSRGETLLMLASGGIRENIYSSKDEKANGWQTFFNKTEESVADEKSYKCVELLLNLGADPLLSSNDGRTALMQAANFGHRSVVSLLINNVAADKREAYIKQPDNVGSTAYTYAGQLGQFWQVHQAINGILDDKIKEVVGRRCLRSC